MSDLPDTSAWTDDDWLAAMRVAPFPLASPRDEAIALVSSWNRFREFAQGSKAATAVFVGTTGPSLPYAVRHLKDEFSTDSFDLVMVAVPRGTGHQARAAITRSMGVGP
jgi:hypothetical protein